MKNDKDSLFNETNTLWGSDEPKKNRFVTVIKYILVIQLQYKTANHTQNVIMVDQKEILKVECFLQN